MASPAKSQLGIDFALAYEASAERLTGPIARAALVMAGDIKPGIRIVDVAAGTGALSVPAAEQGADVLATDNAPGMIERLTQRLNPYPNSKALLADGEDLHLPDSSFDAAFSLFGGHILFSNWRKGLTELARVIKSGGRGCVSTWLTPPGGGPFVLIMQALQSVFPDRPSPPMKEGMRILSSPDRLQAEMHSAGFDQVEVSTVEYAWEAAAGEGYLEDTDELYSYLQPYAQLETKDRQRVRSTLLKILEQYTVGDHVKLPSPALIAVGHRI